MKHDDGTSGLLGRRRTLKLLGLGLGGASVVALGCSKSSGGLVPVESDGKDCNATFDDTSKTMRHTLQYADKAVAPDKHCSACLQYTAGAYGDCGSCKLFTGPVNPNGGCLSFAPKVPGPAPAKST